MPKLKILIDPDKYKIIEKGQQECTLCPLRHIAFCTKVFPTLFQRDCTEVRLESTGYDQYELIDS